MAKLLPIGVLIIMVVMVLSVRFILWDNFTPSQTSGTTQNGGGIKSATDQLKNTLSNLSSSSKSASLTQSSNLDTRVLALETEVNDLKDEVNQLKDSSSSSHLASVYIPLGYGGAATSLNYSTIDTYEVSLDPADYPGYSSVSLELSLRVYQGNGTAYARLVDTTDSQPIWQSEVSTTNQNYNWLYSPQFTLPAGKKTYKLQLKTLTGYEAGVQNARLKVIF